MIKWLQTAIKGLRPLKTYDSESCCKIWEERMELADCTSVCFGFSLLLFFLVYLFLILLLINTQNKSLLICKIKLLQPDTVFNCSSHSQSYTPVQRLNWYCSPTPITEPPALIICFIHAYRNNNRTDS